MGTIHPSALEKNLRFMKWTHPITSGRSQPGLGWWSPACALAIAVSLDFNAQSSHMWIYNQNFAHSLNRIRVYMTPKVKIRGKLIKTNRQHRITKTSKLQPVDSNQYIMKLSPCGKQYLSFKLFQFPQSLNNCLQALKSTEPSAWVNISFHTA